MSALELMQEAERHGLSLSRVGNDLHVMPGGLCPTDFADALRAHKPELLALLANTNSRTKPTILRPYRQLADHDRDLLMRFRGNQNDPIIIAALNLFHGRIVGLSRRSRLHNQIQLDMFEGDKIGLRERNEQAKKRGQ